MTGTEAIVAPAELPEPLTGYLRDAAATSYAFVPFGAGTPAAGGLVVVSCTGPRDWTTDELAFLDGVVADLSRALEQVRLDEQQ